MGKKGKRKAKKKSSSTWSCSNCTTTNSNTIEQCTSCGDMREINITSKTTIPATGPRTTASILGRIVPGKAPTRKVVKQLSKSLDILIKEHQPIVTAIKEGNSPPVTFETPGMLTMSSGNGLLFPGSPMGTTLMELPAAKIGILADGDFGENDHQQQFNGGVCTVLNLQSIHNPNQTSLFYYLGTCHFTSKDLWDFAVMFRSNNGTFVWPKYETCLMCPMCAAIPKPDDTLTKEWILTSQFLMQEGTGKLKGRIGQRLMGRMFCKECFTDEVDPKTGKRDAVMQM